ncbi:PTS sugar transporter subunit IIA [Companilactobacillus nuruki]|uniref:PTS sugar transporter n=1 Tax=Companilactobacillus nuruki TaxID=1993540 RepID=A0A2N7AWE7_9LACO|nr:PTS sugar transporter subunit IIA [Companilactobacillus nuruki]PMD73079.1 PTS sugar transporter [Companilactobacillus nuruki]
MPQYKTIVTGHGKFATGFEGAVKLLAGKQLNMKFINFEDGMSEVDLREEYLKAIGNEPVLFFTDLIGGTPYKEAAKIAYKSENVLVVAGCNLASLLETTFNSYDNLKDYANDLVSVTKNSTELFEMNDSEKVDDSEDFEDGI